MCGRVLSWQICDVKIAANLRYVCQGTNTTSGKESAVLAIPERCVDRSITLYNSSIFGGHQGVIEMYLTIRLDMLP